MVNRGGSNSKTDKNIEMTLFAQKNHPFTVPSGRYLIVLGVPYQSNSMTEEKTRECLAKVINNVKDLVLYGSTQSEWLNLGINQSIIELELKANAADYVSADRKFIRLREKISVETIKAIHCTEMSNINNIRQPKKTMTGSFVSFTRSPEGWPIPKETPNKPSDETTVSAPKKGFCTIL